MDSSVDRAFEARAGGLLRSAANDLKRDDATAEADLGLPAGAFAEFTSGRRPVTSAHRERAAEVWPLNERDLLPIHDDCPDGVLIYPVKASEASSRTLHRGGTAYYEYRDTAMSRVASFRPEWIRMLCVVDDADPDNPALRWNNGHLLYQFTYFVGPVNYYYRSGSRSYAAEMETGDSVWGIPFAPHTFAARAADRPAYILALTYGGGLTGDAQRELAVLGPDTAARLALPVANGPAQAALIGDFLRARLGDRTALAAWSGVAEERLARLLAGDDDATVDELAAIAGALGVSPRDLLPPRDRTSDGVRLSRREQARRWDYPSADPAYAVVELAGNPLHPHTSALELGVRSPAARDDAWLRTYQHQYLYVLDGSPVEIGWEHGGITRSHRLDPGDSCYVLPDVPIVLSCATGDASVLMLRIGGAVTPDVRFALGTMAGGGVGRYVHEGQMWYSAGDPAVGDPR